LANLLYHVVVVSRLHEQDFPLSQDVFFLPKKLFLLAQLCLFCLRHLLYIFLQPHPQLFQHPFHFAYLILHCSSFLSMHRYDNKRSKLTKKSHIANKNRKHSNIATTLVDRTTTYILSSLTIKLMMVERYIHSLCGIPRMM